MLLALSDSWVSWACVLRSPADGLWEHHNYCTEMLERDVRMGESFTFAVFEPKTERCRSFDAFTAL